MNKFKCKLIYYVKFSKASILKPCFFSQLWSVSALPLNPEHSSLRWPFEVAWSISSVKCWCFTVLWVRRWCISILSELLTDTLCHWGMAQSRGTVEKWMLTVLSHDGRYWHKMMDDFAFVCFPQCKVGIETAD